MAGIYDNGDVKECRIKTERRTPWGKTFRELRDAGLAVAGTLVWFETSVEDVKNGGGRVALIGHVNQDGSESTYCPNLLDVVITHYKVVIANRQDGCVTAIPH